MRACLLSNIFLRACLQKTYFSSKDLCAHAAFKTNARKKYAELKCVFVGMRSKNGTLVKHVLRAFKYHHLLVRGKKKAVLFGKSCNTQHKNERDGKLRKVFLCIKFSLGYQNFRLQLSMPSQVCVVYLILI